MSSFYILDIIPISDTWFPNVFSHSVGCLFTLWYTKLLILISLSIFLCCLCFCYHTRRVFKTLFYVSVLDKITVQSDNYFFSSRNNIAYKWYVYYTYFNLPEEICSSSFIKILCNNSKKKITNLPWYKCDETTHNYECKASITLVLALLCYNELIYISDDIKMCLISLWENIKTTHLAIEFFSFNKYLFSYLYKVL